VQLIGTTDKIELTRSSTANVDVVAEYVDATGGNPPAVQGDSTTTQVSTFNTAATGEIVAASAVSGELRRINEITITNRHASLSVDVTVLLDRSGTDYRIIGPLTLRPGESLHYIRGMGWLPIYLPSNPTLRPVKLGSDQSNSTTTLTEVAGLSVTTGVGTFSFNYKILYQAAVTTTGVRFSVNHTGTVTAFVANVHGATADTTATATQTGVADQDAIAATTHLFQVIAARAKSTTGWGTTAGVDTANADMLTEISGLLICTVDGDIELWHGSEVAAASTVKAGSSLILTRTGD
jgi:hypothetical protein